MLHNSSQKLFDNAKSTYQKFKICEVQLQITATSLVRPVNEWLIKDLNSIKFVIAEVQQ